MEDWVGASMFLRVVEKALLESRLWGNLCAYDHGREGTFGLTARQKR